MILTLRLLVPPTLLAVLCVASVSPVHGQAPSDALAQISESTLKCRRQGSTVLVSYHLDGAIGPEVRSSLDSGITVTFIHKLTVWKRRAFFFDKSLVSRKIEASASLDTLTQQYTLRRVVDGSVTESSSTDRVDEVERWLSDVHNATIQLPDDGNRGSIELRVKAEYQPNYYVLWVLPWTLSAKGDKECR